MKYELAIIGVGMMGEAILNGLIAAKAVSPENIAIYDVDQEKMRRIAASSGAQKLPSASAAAEQALAILLAVKPQYLDKVLTELDGKIPEKALVLSIVAGIPTKVIAGKLNHRKIVRIMPNTPAAIREGFSGWYATSDVTAEQKAFVQKFLNAIGTAIEVMKEEQLNVITAVSGSGPAYVFLFIEAMIDSAVRLGMTRTDAAKCVIQTIKGSAAYLENRNNHPAVLRSEVTSPGGTTAEAICAMEKAGIRAAIDDGMTACCKKAIELGKSIS